MSCSNTCSTKNVKIKALPRKMYHTDGYPFEVPERYEINSIIGRGAYGIVASATDTVTKTKVAVKKISNMFVDLVDGKRILREIKLLSFLNHPNVLHMVDIFRPRRNTYITNSLNRMMMPSKNLFSFPKKTGKEGGGSAEESDGMMPQPNINKNDFFADIYVVSDLMSTDLGQVLKCNENELSEDHSRFFVYQMCCGLHYVHSAGVIHRDMKPANMLINDNCELKIADFGLARQASGSNLTEYVVTRWYRPPELLLVSNSYDTSVDMWGVGVLAIETLTRQTVFPGKDYLNQIVLITDVLGTPSESDLKNVKSKEALSYIQSLPKKQRKIEEILSSKLLSGASKEMIDFVTKLLVYDSSKRMTALQAMQHPWLESLFNKDDIKTSLVKFEWKYDNVALSLEQLKEMVKEEVDKDTLENWRACE